MLNRTSPRGRNFHWGWKVARRNCSNSSDFALIHQWICTLSLGSNCKFMDYQENWKKTLILFLFIFAVYTKSWIELSKAYILNSDIIRWNEQLHGYLCHISMFVLYKILSGNWNSATFRCQNIIKPIFMNDNFSSEIHCYKNAI